MLLGLLNLPNGTHCRQIPDSSVVRIINTQQSFYEGATEAARVSLNCCMTNWCSLARRASAAKKSQEKLKAATNKSINRKNLKTWVNKLPQLLRDKHCLFFLWFSFPKLVCLTFTETVLTKLCWCIQIPNDGLTVSKIINSCCNFCVVLAVFCFRQRRSVLEATHVPTHEC